MLAKGKRDIFVSAAAWLNVIKYVEKYYLELKVQDITDTNGYYMNVERVNPIHIPTNFIQIHARHCKLGSELIIDEHGKRKVESVFEGGAALVFSQHMNGTVLILLYPYSSKCYSMNENYLIFRKFNSAVNISERDVEKSFAAFLRYSQATSCLTRKSLGDQLFRWRYLINDWKLRWLLLGKIKDLVSVIKP